MGKVYPRSTFRKNLKQYMTSDGMMSRSVDVLIYLDYVLFLEELLKQASLEARHVEGSSLVRKRYVQDSATPVLKKFKGT